MKKISAGMLVGASMVGSHGAMTTYGADGAGRIEQISRADAALSHTFVMYLDADLDGQPDQPEPNVYFFGDMTTGQLRTPRRHQ